MGGRERSLERTLLVRSAGQMHQLGRRLGAAAAPGDILALSGPLGAGKTCLVQGLARALGVPEKLAVTSPTFSLVHELPGRMPLYHVDLYRLEGAEIDELGLDELMEGQGVTAVEWAERWPVLLQLAHALIEMEVRGDERWVRIRTDEPRLARALEEPEA